MAKSYISRMAVEFASLSSGLQWFLHTQNSHKCSDMFKDDWLNFLIVRC